MKKRTAKYGTRRQVLGFILEKSIAGWWILDWDYETTTAIAGPFKTFDQAHAKACALSY